MDRDYWMSVRWSIVSSSILFIPLTLIILLLSFEIMGLALVPVLLILSILRGLENPIPQLSLAWRRLHGTNRIGAFCFLRFVPLGGIFLFLGTLLQGSAAPNRCGADPLLARDDSPGTGSFGLSHGDATMNLQGFPQAELVRRICLRWLAFRGTDRNRTSREFSEVPGERTRQGLAPALPTSVSQETSPPRLPMVPPPVCQPRDTKDHPASLPFG